jgi:4a-hydroxytetrahydrobiopterin dehydratase
VTAEPVRAYAEEEVRAALGATLPAWRHEHGHITRSYATGDWQRAMALANAIGFLAEAAWHHPEIHLSWGRVTVRLRTHEPDGVTERDFALARRIEELATWRPAPGDALAGPEGGWIR